MKVVILAGGLGTRLSEETDKKPKPMIEIGGQPILWHIMKGYSYYGFNDFIICAGYKGYIIKDYFKNYFFHQSDITFDLKNNNIEFHNSRAENWRVSVIDTGLETMTGGRIKKIQQYIGKKTFMLTYGDGVSDINLKKLLEFHKKKGKYATLTAINPERRFGALIINNENIVASFNEKPKTVYRWINGGFFVLEPQIFEYIKGGNETLWEREPLENLAEDSQLTAYKHKGFWKCMDHLRDKTYLEELWSKENCPWKIWKD